MDMLENGRISESSSMRKKKEKEKKKKSLEMGPRAQKKTVLFYLPRRLPALRTTTRSKCSQSS